MQAFAPPHPPRSFFRNAALQTSYAAPCVAVKRQHPCIIISSTESTVAPRNEASAKTESLEAEASIPASNPSAESAARNFGFASLMGPSNSGKSTLMNRLVGSKVAIVTPKEQTTRCRIAGIVTYDSTQVAYLDTPGIFDGTSRLDRAMVKSAWGSGNDGDTISIIMDIGEMYHVARKRGILPHLHISDGLAIVLEGLVKKRNRSKLDNKSVCFCVNKIDTIPTDDRPEVLLRVVETLDRWGFPGAQVFPMSARHGDGIDEFTAWITSNMPAGPWMYPEEYSTDMSARLIAAEVTREKLFMYLQNELPYEVAVETTSYKDQPDGSIRITQEIYVRRDSQLRIVTGRGGAMVKKIGMKSREELKDILGGTVHLMLKVKVRQKWKEDSSSYDQWGLDYAA